MGGGKCGRASDFLNEKISKELSIMEPLPLDHVCSPYAKCTVISVTAGINHLKIKAYHCHTHLQFTPVAYPGILLGEGGGSTNSIEDRGQRTGIWGW